MLSAALVGCAGKPSAGGMLVLVELEPNLTSLCVKVRVSDSAQAKDSKPIVLAGQSSPLRVAVFGDGLVQPVTVQATGFADEGCTTLSGEVSEIAEATFGVTVPPPTVTVTLRAVSNGDGGFFGPDGGTDGGADAGIDNDLDGYPLPADCDDTNAAVHPNAAESCGNGIDDNCNGLTDCLEPLCDGLGCVGGGTCTLMVCRAQTEVSCTDGVDNDGDGFIDCADSDCLGMTCSDNNSCTTGDRCVADGGCERTMDTACTTPPNTACYVATGTCLPDAGASCEYTPKPGACVDGLSCTDGDTCTAGTCAGTPHVCPAPANACLSSMGTCHEPNATCTYAPRATGACDDGQNCTINDSCDGDGGCKGTQVTCTPPSQCQVATGACAVDGGCLFSARAGLPCDAGIALGAATCDSSLGCNVTPTTLFPTPPSNFTETQLPLDAGTGFTVSCATTLNTSGTPSLTGGCVTMPPTSIITQGGESTLLVRVTGLTVNAGQTLTITGTRPVIFAVVGSVVIDGTIRATNAGSPTACGNGGNGGGGGGAGFATVGAIGGAVGGNNAGAVGIANGVASLIPLRSGCNGGNGNGAGGTGGQGGGALQITASGSIIVASTGIVTAPGKGGGGGSGTNASGGGGGSGGSILMEAPTVVLSGTAKLTANGGGGGGGEDGGTGGGAGAPGSETTATPALGGTAVVTAGAGGAGGAGTTPPGPGINDDNDGAGGGGGAVGRIQINATTCTRTGGAQVVSPGSTGTVCN